MTWLNFDLFRFEWQMFEDSLNHRVREAYLAAYSVLEKAYGERQEELYKELNTITEDPDGEYRALTTQVINYEKSRWMEQRKALAAMAIALLASQTKTFLDEQKIRWHKTHPADPKGYAGKSELLKLVTEYRARFDIDLEKIGGFDTVLEVALARNCCLHKGGLPDEDYTTKTKQRFLDDNGEISLKLEQLDSIIGELSQFGKSLNALMSDVWKKAKSDNGGNERCYLGYFP
jgi:hypothetical protein